MSLFFPSSSPSSFDIVPGKVFVMAFCTDFRFVSGVDQVCHEITEASNVGICQNYQYHRSIINSLAPICNCSVGRLFTVVQLSGPREHHDIEFPKLFAESTSCIDGSSAIKTHASPESKSPEQMSREEGVICQWL